MAPAVRAVAAELDPGSPGRHHPAPPPWARGVGSAASGLAGDGGRLGTRGDRASLRAVDCPGGSGALSPRPLARRVVSLAAGGAGYRHVRESPSDQPAACRHPRGAGLAAAARDGLRLSSPRCSPSVPIAEPDLFWHLAVGRYVATEHRLPPPTSGPSPHRTTRFSPASWLFDLLPTAARLGEPGRFELGTALVVGPTFAVLFLAVRARGASVAWAAAVSLALAVGSEARFTPRPEVLGRLLMALLCLVLVRDLTRRSWRELALVPVLLALWANVHAGVVFGLGVVGCHLLGRALPPPVSGCRARRAGGSCSGAPARTSVSRRRSSSIPAARTSCATRSSTSRRSGRW